MHKVVGCRLLQSMLQFARIATSCVDTITPLGELTVMVATYYAQGESSSAGSLGMMLRADSNRLAATYGLSGTDSQAALKMTTKKCVAASVPLAARDPLKASREAALT